ncbi:MAG: hypothetical protein KGL53_03000, partial [Elusimicrobia bacterium]|nr:hypothetical protein [Elusimicrobiota bacterium]
IPGYQDEAVWLWQSALALRVLDGLGREALLERVTAAVCGLVVRDGAAGEVYDPRTGLPLEGRLYRSESPFTWSSAMLLEALAPLAARSQSPVPEAVS